MASAAGRAGLDATVPSCPDWTVRDLVHHTGGVHRFAADTVANARAEFPDLDLIDYAGGAWPADPAVLGWFRDGVAALAATLRSAPADVHTAQFLAAPSSLAFWARRQADETAIHRVDAELAAGAATPVDAAFAAQGLDELLSCFIVRPFGKLRSPTPRILRFAATDTGDMWTVQVSDQPVVTTRGAADGTADCTVRGSASDLFMAAWNRPPIGSLTIEGDGSLYDHFLDRTHVRWS